MSRSQEAELAEQAAVAGAKVMLAEIASGRAITATRKEDFTFVLNLDMLSDAAIRKVLVGDAGERLVKIVSEEDPASHALLGSLELYFLVDPLDGTNNCRRALNFFGPNLHPMQESFGPIVGVVNGGVIQSVTFVSLTEAIVWSAEKGKGCRTTPLSDELAPWAARPEMMATSAPKLRECGVLFYPGKRGELDLLHKLRTADLVDGCYRLGGYAGDCTRLARAREHMLIQFSMKPWDLAAALLATEAGAVAIRYPQKGAAGQSESAQSERVKSEIAKGEAIKELSELAAYPMVRMVLANRGCAQELEVALAL